MLYTYFRAGRLVWKVAAVIIGECCTRLGKREERVKNKYHKFP